MPHRTSSTRNDYERKINFDWPYADMKCSTRRQSTVWGDSRSQSNENDISLFPTKWCFKKNIFNFVSGEIRN